MDLSDVNLGGTEPANGMFASWSGGKLVPVAAPVSGVTTLSGLSDVDESIAPASGQFAQWDAALKLAPHTLVLSDCADVALGGSEPANGMFAAWSGGKLVPVAAPSAGVTTFSGLTDVDESTLPLVGQIPQWNAAGKLKPYTLRLMDLSDVNLGGTEPANGQYAAWSGGKLVAVAPPSGSGPSSTTVQYPVPALAAWNKRNFNDTIQPVVTNFASGRMSMAYKPTAGSGAAWWVDQAIPGPNWRAVAFVSYNGPDISATPVPQLPGIYLYDGTKLEVIALGLQSFQQTIEGYCFSAAGSCSSSGKVGAAVASTMDPNLSFPAFYRHNCGCWIWVQMSAGVLSVFVSHDGDDWLRIGRGATPYLTPAYVGFGMIDPATIMGTETVPGDKPKIVIGGWILDTNVM
jgi:hypothetical protein